MINDYASLRQAILDWPDLDDEVDLGGSVDTIIGLAEARINDEIRLQRHIMQIAAPEVTDQLYTTYSLPDDYLEMDRVVGPDGQSLEMRSADELDSWGSEPGEPCFYAIDGRRLLFSDPVKSFTFRYYARLGTLSETFTTHWLLQRAPDLYLYAALIHASTFSKEQDTEHTRYEKAYQEAAVRLIRQDRIATEPRSQPLRAVTRTGRKQRYGT